MPVTHSSTSLAYCSQRSHTAVHEQQGAGDVGGIVGGQKQDRGGDLLGPAGALQHGALCGLGVILLDGLAGRCNAALMEWREDRARADGVHPNALRRVVGGERPCQARDRGLGSVVLQVAAACDDGTYGGDVNDGAALVAAHQRNRRLGTEGVAHQVNVEDLVPARRACLVDLLVFADAGIVDEDVEAPEFFPGTVDEAEACGLGTNVSLREGDLGAGGLELCRHALAALAVPIAECHARALGNETPDRRLADPRCPARHRCDLAVEPSHVRHLSLHCETRIHDTSYPSGGHRLVRPAWVSDLNGLRKLQASAFGTFRWADPVRLGSADDTLTAPLLAPARTR